LVVVMMRAKRVLEAFADRAGTGWRGRRELISVQLKRRDDA
jgi:hypothetical protein